MNSPVFKNASVSMPALTVAGGGTPTKTGKNSPTLLKTKINGSPTTSPVPGRNRSLSPGRYSPGVSDIQSFGQGALPFNSSEPRSALFRMNTNPSFIYDYSLTVDPNSAAYRYYKASHAAVLTKTNVPLQDQLVTRPNSPPVGTYYLPTFPPELKPSEKRPTSSFKTNGRASAFIENSTMFYKSLRDEVALTNIGPGSYNLAYTWRTDEHNYAHLRASSAPAGLGGFSSSTATGRPDSPSRICCAHKPGTPGQYEKTWLAPKAPLPPLSPRTKQLEKLQERDDVAAVRGLPTY